MYKFGIIFGLLSLSLSVIYLLSPVFAQEIYLSFLAALLVIKTGAIKLFLALKSEGMILLFYSWSKIVGFVKGLTLFQFFILAIKRFVIDNIVSKWLEKNIIYHLKGITFAYWEFFKNISWSFRFKRALFFAFPVGIVVWVLWFGDLFSSVFVAAQLKLIVIGFFKFIWLIFAKIFEYFLFIFTNFIMGTWIASFLEILALSYLLYLLEKVPFLGPPLARFLSAVYRAIESIFYFLYKKSTVLVSINKNHGKVYLFFLSLSKKITLELNKSKRAHELGVVKFLRKVMKSDALPRYLIGRKRYFLDKDHLYLHINKRKKELDVVGFIQTEGNINSIDGDIIFFESSATHSAHGSSMGRICKSGFWVLNNSKNGVLVSSENSLFKSRWIKPKKIAYIRAKDEISFLNKPIYIKISGKKAFIRGIPEKGSFN